MNTKKLLSLVVALAMAASTAATVFAADYPTDEDDDGNDVVVNTPTYGNGTTASNPTPVITASQVSNIIKNTASGKVATVNITSTATMSKSVLKSISAPVTLKAANFSIKIDPSKMTENVDIDCGIKTSAPAAQATFEKYFKEPVAAIACAQQGSFGGVVEIDVKPDQLGNIDTSKPMYVYSWNPKTNKYAKMGTAVLLTNGQIRCSVTRGYNLIISNAASFTAK